MLIDSHVHLFPDRLAAAVRAWFDEHAWDIRYRESADAAWLRLKEGGVERAVVLPYAHKPGIAEALNDFTRQLAERHPELIPCCTVFPGEDGDERLLDRALGEEGFAGIKMHCHVQGCAPDDPRLGAALRASARHQKPLVLHAGDAPATGGYGLDVHTVSGADRLRRALERHPDAIVVVPHLGEGEVPAFVRMLDELPNLYLDTAMAIGGYLAPPPGLDFLRRHPDRVLYGTDYPNLPYAWTRELDALRALKLAPADEALVLGGNAERLFCRSMLWP